MRFPLVFLLPVSLLAQAPDQAAIRAPDPPALTTLSGAPIRYSVPEKPYVVLRRAGVEAVIVNNSAVNDDTLPNHRAGYSGVGSLKHAQRRENLFVRCCGGLNFEHIHDGATAPRDVLFEPRRAPMELRRIDDNTVELYQEPTPNWGLESATRYHLLPDGALEMTFECIPRRSAFKNNYIGLFWASYIHRPESLDIHFIGHPGGLAAEPRWIRGVTPAHGKEATHRAADDERNFGHDEDFPLSLVFGLSQHRYTEPWYYGVSHGMAFVQVFRPVDRIRLTQSPSGGGPGNPAWDFQFLLPDYEVGRRYQMVMRAIYTPYESPQQIRQVVEPHRAALAQ